jgi:hypothetical protein
MKTSLPTLDCLTRLIRFAVLPLLAVPLLQAEEPPAKRAFLDGTGPGWVTLGEQDFVNVNCHEDTWTFPDGEIHCTGQPLGVTRSVKQYTNFELVVEWMHLKHAGNSGLFVWTMPEALAELDGPGLPKGGIEVQILDLGYAEDYREKHGKDSDWFTSHGDIFPVGKSKLKPFPPLSANGSRSFPSKNLTKRAGEWNHYYVRAINGEIRLWVNGEEVSGGSDARPATGYLCLESEGSPIKFRNLRIRELL